MAAREEDKAMAGLLRRSLSQDAGTESGEVCPEPEILAAYFDRALDAEETARYDLHFSRCAVCREQLAAIIRAGGDDVAEEKAARAWDWFVGRRWLMPAAAMVVALLVIGGIALRMRKPVAPANEITMVRPEALPSPRSEPPANSVPSPEAAPSPKVALPETTENLVARPAAPNPRDTASASIELSESQASRVRGATSAAGAKAGVSHANTAARRDELSAVGAASGKPSLRQPAAMQPPPVMTQQNGPRSARGAVRGGNANPAAVGTANSGDTTATVAVNGLAQDKALAPAVAPPSKKADARSVESDLNAAVETEEAKKANGAQTSLPETAVPSRSVTAMNLTASKATQAAALAKLQQAELSSNLMNLQIATPDAKILWMIVEPGAIERSANGGASWKTEYLDTRALIVAGAAPTVKICWLVGASGTILRTTNGAHWKTISPPEQTDLVRVEAADALTATVTAIDGRKFATSDGGKSWSGVK
jgi:hypothetical protein